MKSNVVTIVVVSGLLVICCIVSTFVLGLNGLSIRLGDAVVSSEIKISTATATPKPPAPEVATCTYADGITDAGVEISGGTTVRGPAILQLDTEKVVVVYPGREYRTLQQAVLWLYKGDTNCLLAQLEYFPEKEVEEIK